MKLRRVLALVMALCLLIGQLPATAWAAETSATITFEDTANRTVFTTEQQVWVMDGITFTNDKAAATNNVADYSNPVRCYAGSSVTVAYPGMSRIEYTCYSSTYAANLQKSIGDTATVEDTVVTVTFDAPVDSYLIEQLAAQVRINSVTVYTDAGSEPEDTTAPAEPTEPEETTAPTETTEPEETTAPAETTEPEETTAPTDPSEPEETTAPAEPTEPEETTAPTDPSVPEETNPTIVASGTCGNNVAWELDSNGLLTIFGEGEMGDGAFIENSNIIYVLIEEGVTSVGDLAFFGCGSLLSITIPESVISIGIYAFNSCSSLQKIEIAEGNPNYCNDAVGVLYNKDKTTLVYAPGAITGKYDIPAGVTSVGDSAFADCSSLTSITIPDSVTSIANGAFAGCSSLTNITIPESVISIGSYAFDFCSSLTSITIPGSVTAIGALAFRGCSSLQKIEVAEDNPDFCSDTVGVLYNKDKTTLICAPGAIAGEYEIPAGVNSVVNDAFFACKSLTGVTIPDSVTSIGDTAFADCSSLTSITIPDSVTSIGNYTFNSCSGLTSIVVPDSVTSIGGFAFEGCSSLVSIAIPDSVMSIGDYAFHSCSNLTSITILGGVTSVGVRAFYACNSLTSITIPNSVTSLEYGAFEGCSSLVSITIPDSVTSIGDYAFCFCSNLTSIVIPDSVTAIGKGAFAYCSNLTKIVFKGDAPSAGEDAFFDIAVNAFYPTANTTWTEDVRQDYGGNITWVAAEMGSCGDDLYWTLADGVLMISGSGDMTDFSETAAPWSEYTVTKLVIEAGVTSISSGAFTGCGSLTQIKFLGNAPAIGENAFEGVTAEVSYPVGDTTWTEDVLQNYGGELTWTVSGNAAEIVASGTCGNNVAWELDSNGLLTISGSGNMTHYGYEDYPSPFYNNDAIKSVIIEEGVTCIGTRAFYDCNYLTSVSIPDSVTIIGEEAFSSCDALASAELGAGVTSIGYFAFSNCGNLASVTIPASVTEIVDQAFNHSCYQGIWVDEANPAYTSDASGVLFDKAMTVLIKAPGALTGTYTVPESVKTISAEAFHSCTALTAVTLPAVLESIGYWAFGYCNALRSVHIPASVINIGHHAFYNSCSQGVWVDEANTAYTSDASGVLFDKAMTVLIKAPSGLEGEYRVPETVEQVSNAAFQYCSGLTGITFTGGAPSFDSSVFYGVTATAKYPLYEASWTEDVMQGYGGTLTWVPYDAAASGACGDTLSWVISESGKLVISGTGTMADYSETAAPWSEYTVTELVINAGVTSVSSGAFAGCGSLTQISFQGDAPVIGENAFEGVTAKVSYPYSNDTWTAEIRQNYGGSLTWEEALKLSYPVIERDTETVAEVPEGGQIYFQFTPEFTETYFFYSLATNCDPYAALLDSELNYLTESDDYENLNFGITYTLEAGVTYVLRIGSYSGASSVPVMLQTQHENVTEIVTEASCSVSGLRRHTCQICGQVTEESFYEDHIYGEDDLCVNCGAVWALTGTCGDNVTWSLNRAGKLTISGTGDMANYGWESSPFYCNYEITDIVIEEGVTSIGNCAFIECGNLKTVQIADSVTYIGSHVFAYCWELTSLTISAGVTQIDSNAFYECGITEIQVAEGNTAYCTDASGVLFDKAMTQLIKAPQGLTGAYTVPETVVTINREAFAYCSSLTAISLPESLRTIGMSAFMNCHELREITLSEGLVSIGSSAFVNCGNLMELRIPSSVTEIGYAAFVGCNSLATIWVDEANSAYCTDASGVLFNKDKTHLIRVPICLTDTYNVPEGVTSLGSHAFTYCGVAAVTLPEGITELPDSLFMGCSMMTSVNIPESVTLIDYNTFFGCSKLKELYIPAGVTEIRDGFVNDCESLTAIWVDEDNPSYSSDSYGVLFNKGMTTLYMAPGGMCGSYRIPDTVRRISHIAFRNCGLERIIVTSGVVDIWWGAFNECAELSQIIFCGDIPSLEGELFWNVTATAYYPAGNETWTEDMLQSYGGNITWVAAEMGSCGDSMEWTLADGALLISGSGAMADYSETAAPWSEYTVTSVVIEEGITSISSGAFAGCGGLTKISFLGDAPAIGETAFEGVTAEVFYTKGNETWTEEMLQNYGGSLTWTAKVKLPYPVIRRDVATLAKIPAGGYAYFQFTPEVTETYYFSTRNTWGEFYAILYDSDMNVLAENNGDGDLSFGITYTLEASVTYVLAVGYTDSSSECTLEVTLQAQHEYVTQIVQQATCSEEGLKRHTCQLCGDVVEENYLLDHTYGADDVCTVCGHVGITVGTCGENITWKLNWFGKLTLSGTGAMFNYSAYGSPFSNMDEITSIVVEEGITSIGAYAFHNCYNLVSVSLPEGLTAIEKWAFTNCTGLAEINFPEGLQRIGEDALSCCHGLQEVFLPETMVQIDGWVFAMCSNMTYVNVPAGVTQIGEGVFDFCSVLRNIDVDESNTAYASWNGALFNKAMTTLIQVPGGLDGTFAVPESVTCIGDFALGNCYRLTAITVPAGVAEIGEHAFWGCTGLETLVINPANPYFSSDADCALYNKDKTTLIMAPTYTGSTYTVADGVTTIAEGAIWQNWSLSYLIIPKSVTSIDKAAIFNCAQLQEIQFLGDAPSFDADAFDGLELTVYYPADNDTWTADVMQQYGGRITWEEVTAVSGTCGENVTWLLSTDGVLTISGTGAMTDYNSAEETPWYQKKVLSIVVEEGVTALGAYAFQDLNAVQTVQLPSSLITIGKSAFGNCSKLREITIPENVTTIGERAFVYCNALQEVVIPESVTSVEERAFAACEQLKRVVISSGVISIGVNAFASLNLEEIVVDEANATYSSDSYGVLFNKDKTVLVQVPCALEGAYVIPESVKTVGESAFAYCQQITEVTIPGSVTTLEDKAFMYCWNLVNAIFLGDAPAFGETVFFEVETTVYYPGENATWTEEVMQQHGGSLTWLREGQFALSGASVSLGNSLDMHFFVDPAHVDVDCYAVITRSYADGRENHVVTVPYSEWNALEDGRLYVTYGNIAAKEMGDNISVVIYNAEGEDISGQWDDSIKTYAMRMLRTDEVWEDWELRTLYVDMLNYGAAAQSQFGYDTANLVNAGLTDEQKGFATASYETESNLISGTGRAGTSLTLKSRITLDFIFKNTAIGTDYTGLYAVATYTDHYGNKVETRIDTVKVFNANLGYVSVPGLAVADYGQAVTCTVYDAEGNILAWATDSMEGYAHRMKGSLPQIVEAIVKFGNSSYNYFH